MNRMLSSVVILVSMWIGLPSFSADAPTKWQNQMMNLAEGIDVDQNVQASVLKSLSKWDPYCNSPASQMLTYLPMTIRDRYLEDETVRNLIRDHFLPTVMTRAYERFVGQPLANIDLNALAHGVSTTFVVLKNIHKLPYMLCGLSNGDCHEFFGAIDAQDCLKSACAIGSHVCAVAAGVSGAPIMIVGSCILGAGAFYWSIEDEFTDVVLRHHKRSFKKTGKTQKLALIEHMIAKRKLINAKED